MASPVTHRVRLVDRARAALRFDPVAVDLVHGARLAVIVGVPLVLGLAADRLDVALYVALASLNVGLADPGGAYRRRLLAMVIGSVTMTAAIAISSAVVGFPVLSVVLVALWSLGSALAADIGPAASGVGFVTAVVFIVGLGLPEGDPSIGFRVVWFVVGCAWALLVTFALWPIRPDAPVHNALGVVYARVARYLSAMPHDDASRSAARDEIAAELIRARAVALTRQRGRRAGVRHAIAALKAAETLELGLGTLDRAMGELDDPPAELTDALAAIEACCRALAEPKHGGEPWNTDELQEALQALADADLDGPAEIARGALFLMVGDLAHPGEPHPESDRGAPARVHVAARLGALIDFESLVLRHALRLGAVVGIAQVLALLDPFERGYWIPLTVVTVLKPDLGATLDRGLQRIIGTMVGVVIALALVSIFEDSQWTLTVCLILAVFAIGTVIEANYAVGVVAITPSIILLLSVAGANPDVVWERLFDTLVGGGLAFLGGLALWPMWARTTLGGTLGDAAAASAAYLRQVVGGTSVPEMRRAHRLAERRRSNAEASLRRMLSEPHRTWIAPADVMAFCGRTRSIIETTTGLRTVSLQQLPDEPDRRRRLPELIGDAPEELDAIESMFAHVEDEAFGAADRDAAAVGGGLGSDVDDVASEAPEPYGRGHGAATLERLGGDVRADADAMRRNAVAIAREL